MQTSDGFRTKQQKKITTKITLWNSESRTNNHSWAKIKKKTFWNQNIVLQKIQHHEKISSFASANYQHIHFAASNWPLNKPNSNHHCFVIKCRTKLYTRFFSRLLHISSPIFFCIVFGLIYSFISGHFSVVAFVASVALHIYTIMFLFTVRFSVYNRVWRWVCECEICFKKYIVYTHNVEPNQKFHFSLQFFFHSFFLVLFVCAILCRVCIIPATCNLFAKFYTFQQHIRICISPLSSQSLNVNDCVAAYRRPTRCCYSSVDFNFFAGSFFSICWCALHIMWRWMRSFVPGKMGLVHINIKFTKYMGMSMYVFRSFFVFFFFLFLYVQFKWTLANSQWLYT